MQGVLRKIFGCANSRLSHFVSVTYKWVAQSVKWMDMAKWDACSFGFDPKRLEGRLCFGGLDLSATTDITALVLVFPPEYEDDKYVVVPYFWIPKDSLEARVRRDHVPYDEWKARGLINTTEGNVIHYSFIEKFIEDLGKKYRIAEIAMDEWGAWSVEQNLSNKGFTMLGFKQSMQYLSSPTKELYRLVMMGKIAHAGNLPLRWMVENIVVKTDASGNIRPDKAKATERIDGIVALIMALDRALRHGNRRKSVYDERGIISYGEDGWYGFD